MVENPPINTWCVQLIPLLLQSMVNMHGAKLVWWMSELLWLYDHQFIKTTLRSLVVLLKKIKQKHQIPHYQHHQSFDNRINRMCIIYIYILYNYIILLLLHNIIFYYGNDVWTQSLKWRHTCATVSFTQCPKFVKPLPCCPQWPPQPGPTLPPGRPLMTWARSIFAFHYWCTWIWTVFCFQHIQRFIC